MPNSLLINVMLGEIRAALIEAGRVVELFVERKGHHSLIGNIFLGRVERILPGMDAAFVDIGFNRAGFLGIDGARRPDSSREEGGRIGDYLREGQAVCVQVARDAVGRKGVQLTRRIALAGRHLVFTPLQDRIAVSRQIDSEDERERLQHMVAEFSRPGSGFIVRTAAAGAVKSEFAPDADYLLRQWEQIEVRRARATAPALLHEDLSPLLRLFRDRVGTATEAVWIDSPSAFAEARDFCHSFMPALAQRLKLHTAPEPIFEDADVEAEIERALGPRVELPSGGEVVIESTEALTAVDVNSAHFTGSDRLEDTAFATNLEAAAETARQLRLRNIGGMIVIDFIHMREDEHWHGVLETLTQSFAGDRNNVRVMGRTAAGLVELTRHRPRESLVQIMTEVCQSCGGQGRIASSATVAYEIMRAMKREARTARTGSLVVMASSEIIDSLEATAAGGMSKLEASLGRRIRLDRDPAYRHGSFDILVEDAAPPR